MKIKNLLVAFGAVLVFFTLANCVFSQQSKDEIKQLIPQTWRNDHPEAAESLAKKIYDDNVELSEHFQNGSPERIDKMTRKYARMGGQIVDKGYNVVSSKDAERFNGFWTEARAQGNTIRFTTKSIYVTDTLGSQTGVVIEEGRAPHHETFNYVAFVVHEISLERTVPAPPGPVYDPPEIRVYRHQQSCTW